MTDARQYGFHPCTDRPALCGKFLRRHSRAQTEPAPYGAAEVCDMTDMRQGGKAAAGRWLALPYLVAGLIGVACAALVGHAWEKSIPVPATNLRQALSDFDSGRLTAATGEIRAL